MTYQVMDNGVVRDATPDEVAEIDIRANALPNLADYVIAIQSMLDTKAQERRYYDILSACTYATDPNSTFQAEAQACVAWRGSVWATAYQVLDEVTAGTRSQPTIAEMLALLPTMEWPA